MIRVVIFVRDMVIALALAWIGVTIEPVREEACPNKGADAAPAAMMCTGARAPSFSVGGFGVELAAQTACPAG
jgi:hypothetical protein